MTSIQLQLAEAVIRRNEARANGDPDWIDHDREVSFWHDLRLHEIRKRQTNERQYPPTQFERVPDEGLL